MEATGATTDIKIRQGYFDPITVTMELGDNGSSSNQQLVRKGSTASSVLKMNIRRTG